jgi:hypothetical protein
MEYQIKPDKYKKTASYLLAVPFPEPPNGFEPLT